MKRHVQEPGIKRWYGPDLIDLQAEPMKAIDGLLKPYDSCVLSGCEISGTTTKSIAPGLLLFTWQDGATRQSVVAEFVGAAGIDPTFTRWLRLDQETITREYETGGAKPIAIYKKAVISTSQPAEPFVVITQNGAQKSFRDALQSANYRFVSDTEKSGWNGKLDASEVVATAAANKVLRLNANAQFPATVIAQTSTHRLVSDTERNTWNAKAGTEVATAFANGLMAAADKSKLNGIAENANNYSHPSTHPHTMITGLGTAATATLQTANNDNITGRALAVGAFGLGAAAVSLGTPNLNTILTTGFYYCSSPNNAPLGAGNGWLLVERLSDLFVTQTYTSLTSRKWFRSQNNGNWGGWLELFHSGNFTNKSQDWDSAYAWGNHANAGYLTSLPAHNHSAANIISGTLSDLRLPTTMSQKIFSGPITVGNSSFVAHLSFVRNGNNVIHTGGGSGSALAFITGNKSIETNNFCMLMDASNRVAINKASASYNLDVSGSIRATGNVLADSDIRLKQNIMPIESALKKVLSLTGVSFEWKKDGVKSIGLIAQEVQKVIPEAVKTAEDGIMSVDYGILTALLIEAIKELKI